MLRGPSTSELSAAWESIHSIWSGESLRLMECSQCKKRIPEDTAFARTYAVNGESEGEGEDSKGIRLSALSDRIEIFNRHLHCLFDSSAQYVAISHVGDQDVSRLQYHKRDVFSLAARACTVLRDTSLRIAESIAADLFEPFEIWYDYISVPQWAPSVKWQMLGHIPAFFRHAKFTLALLADVGEDSFNDMRLGPSNLEKCRGIGRICSAAWFGRMWTAMELSQSPEVRVMARDYKLVPPDAEDPLITHEIWRRWTREVEEGGSATGPEAIVRRDSGRNLTPWQLGTIMPVRLDILAKKRTIFANVHDLLSRRRVTIQRDFLQALEGLLKTGVTLLPDADINESLLHLAHTCILDGDLSPLFMKPASARSGIRIRTGYANLATWALGVEERHPTFPEVRQLESVPNTFVLQAQEVGVLKSARFFDWEAVSQDSMLNMFCRMAIEACGPDVDSFVNTVGARLYAQPPDELNARLDMNDRRSRLRAKLQALYDNPKEFESPDNLNWIADVLALSSTSLGRREGEPVLTPMTFVKQHGNTVHHGNLGAIARIACTQCRAVHLMRIFLYKPDAIIRSAKAYRIPGLKYRFTHAGGVGFLLQERRIVGRFLWGYPTCACPRLVEVEVTVDDLPLNVYDPEDWLHLAIEKVKHVWNGDDSLPRDF